MTAPRDLTDRLADVVGPRGVLRRPSELVVYRSDGLPGYSKQPRIAVFPRSRDELIGVVRILADAKVPFVPRGAGTGLSGGALADDVVLVGLNRLTRILSIDPVERLAVVEPGVADGFRVDAEGRVWSSSGDSVQVFAPSGGLIARIPVPETVGNLCFGGADGRTLFIAASTSIYAIDTLTTAAARPVGARS